MRLVSCHVDNFGKLSNININFNEGINIINEPNGWGKSTLAAFLRAMLYGFDTKKEPGAFEKERKLYTPWQGGTYGGYLDIDISGKLYRINRVFGSTEKTDSFSLINLETNVECEDYSDNIGEELFELDRNSFKRTIYIAQNDCYSGATDAIHAKLGNLVENTNDINNFEAAQERIKDLMNKLSPNRLTGSIKKRKNTISQLEFDIKSYEVVEKSMEEISGKLEEKRQQKKELQQIRQDYAKALRIASEDSRRQELKNNYNSLCQAEKNSMDSYDQVVAFFKGEIPTEELIDQQIGKARELEKSEITAKNLEFTLEEAEKYNATEAVFAGTIPSDEEIDEMLGKVSNITKVRGEHGQLEMRLSQMESVALLTNQENLEDSYKKSGLPVLGIILLILGIIVEGVCGINYGFAKIKGYDVIFLAMAIAAGIIAVLGIVFIAIGNSANKKKALELIRKKEERENARKAKEEPIEEIKGQLAEIVTGIDKLEHEVANFLARFGILYNAEKCQSQLYELKAKSSDYRRLIDKLEKCNEAKAKSSQLMEEIQNFGEEYQLRLTGEFISELNDIKARLSECRILSKNVEEASTRKKEFEETHDIESIVSPAECPYSLEELNSMIREVENRIEDVQAGIDQYSRQIEDFQEQLELRDEKIAELDECNVLQKEEQDKYDILDITKDYLQAAKEQFTARYMAPIADGFQKYYGILTGDESRNWIVDANLSFKMREYGELRDTKWLSAGYQDLIGICMRFALVDAMYEAEKPFLILDDPFINLDDEKASHGKALLIALEKDYQAIYFTCHESREYQAK